MEQVETIIRNVIPAFEVAKNTFMQTWAILMIVVIVLSGIQMLIPKELAIKKIMTLVIGLLVAVYMLWLLFMFAYRLTNDDLTLPIVIIVLFSATLPFIRKAI